LLFGVFRHRSTIDAFGLFRCRSGCSGMTAPPSTLPM